MAVIPMLPIIIDNKPYQDRDAHITTNHSAHLKAPYAEYQSATASSTNAACSSSLDAFKSWSRTPPTLRRGILQKTAALVRENAAELVRLQIEETNCSQQWAERNVEWSALHLEEMAGRITSVLSGELPVVETPGVMGLVYKHPIGPVLSIPPWNAAVFLACRTIDTPIAVGCTVVLKASEQCPRTHHFLASLFHQAGLPAGVLNVIQARREDAALVTKTAIAHPAIRKIEFIGSAAVGRTVASTAGEYLKPAMIELGGKAAAIVLEDADLDLAAQAAVVGGFMHHGQICFSTERVVARQEIATALVEKLKEKASHFPAETAISAQGPKRTIELVEEALSKGAQLLYGEVKNLSEVSLQPVLLGNVSKDAEIVDEESFGPVLLVQTVESDEEAIEVANSTQYGLSAAIFSKDVGRAWSLARQLDVGQTHVNWPYGTGHDEATLPIGIQKTSGYGAQNGYYGLEQFLVLKTVTVTDPAPHMAALAGQ